MVGSIIRHAGLLLGPLATQRVHLQGSIIGTEVPLRALYVGSGASLPFLTAQLFAQGDMDLLRTDAGSTQPVDLLLTERPPLLSALAPPRSEIRIPAWISQYVDLRGAGLDMSSLFSRHLRREVERRTRRCGYSLDFKSDTASVRRFFTEMYQPYVRSRFDRQAIMVSEEVFLQRSASQTLACLHSNGEWIAGMLLKRDRHALRFGWFGARSDPPPPGASEVLDALVIRWAAGQGLREVVLGHSRPCLNDGVLRYKRRFGARIRATPFPQPQIFIRFLNCSDALAGCLDAAGLIRVRSNKVLAHRVESHRGHASVRLESVTDERA